MKPVVICSVIGSGPREVADNLRRVPAACGMMEIRADRLAVEDIAGLVRRSPRPVLVTVRSRRDGGFFDGSEDERRRSIVAALEAGADLVDVEWDGPLADLASGVHADRVVLSHHGAPCRLEPLRRLFRDMASTRAARLKIVPRAERASDADAVRELLREVAREGKRLACFAAGAAGSPTRVMAPFWGSWATYGSIGPGRETAEGQLSAGDLLDVYRVLDIGPSTKRYALVGRPIATSPSPAMHRAAYDELGLDACYLPVEARTLDDVVPLAGEKGVFGFGGLAVTIPFKEEAARRSTPGDEVARRAGAANTVVVEGTGWTGFNTDGPAALSLVRRYLKPAGASVVILGAGGTARAVAAALSGAGADVTVLNRTEGRARALATDLGRHGLRVAAGGLDALAGSKWDVLVQATPLGRRGEEAVPPARLTGRLVLEVVYGARPTPLVREARRRGLDAVSGFDLLVEQAVLQCERLTGARPRRETMASAGKRWLEGRDEESAPDSTAT